MKAFILPSPGFAPILDAPSERAPEVTVAAGKRAVALVSASKSYVINLSAAPVELFKRVEFRGSADCTRVRVYPNHLEKTFKKDGNPSR